MATAADKLAKVVAACRRAAPVYGRSWPAILLRVARLRLYERFSPKEAFLWGLANPDLPERLKRRAALNTPDRKTYYGGDASGFTDYPTLSERDGAAA